jgi:phosphoribosylglycinamide formyltransferase-1
VSVRVAVFASGGGTNLQALIDHFEGADTARVALVITDREGAGALDRARAADIPTRVVPVKDRPATEVGADTIEALESAGIDVVALAGYLRLMPSDVVRRFPRRILNIHPALLPSFGGKGMYGRHVHRAVLEAGCAVSGATVHFVDEEYDRGRIVAQWPVPVLRDDTPATLAARVLRVEHALYPAAVEWVARRVAAEDGDSPAGAPATGGSGTGLPAGRLVDTAAYALKDSEGPDRAGIRRMFGLEEE